MKRLRSELVMVGLGLSLAAQAAVGQALFQGKLRAGLTTDASSDAPQLWKRDKVVAELGGVVREDVRATFSGTLAFGLVGSLRDFHAKGCYVVMKDGEQRFFLDTDGDGKFSAEEGSLFNAGADGPGSFHDRASAEFKLKLPNGSMKTMPVNVWVADKDDAKELGEARVGVLYTATPYIMGEVGLPERKVTMRFDFDPRSGKVVLDKAREWMDINGDGHLDTAAGSVEAGVVKEGSLPVFHVGKLFLQAKSVDVESMSFVMKSVPAPANYTRVEMMRGGRLPDFVFKSLDGKESRLSAVHAKYRLLDFWATWCGPCLAALPDEKAAYEKFRSKGFEIVGVLGDDNSGLAKKQLSKVGATWVNAEYDRVLIQKYFQISTWPTVVLIDEQNRIVSMGDPNQLPLRGKGLEETLAKLMP